MSVCFFVDPDQNSASTASDDVETDDAVEQCRAVDYTQQNLNQFWEKVTEDIQNATADDFKTQVLPLARIKKIMKLDEDVKMISAEAIALFAKTAEIFIHELTLRACSYNGEFRKKTLQRNDIAKAISKSDQFDFLIDIVPPHKNSISREGTYLRCTPFTSSSGQQPTTTTSPATTTSDTNLLSQPMMLMQQVVSPSVEMQQLPQPTTTTSPATTTSDTNLLSQPMMLMQQVVSPSVEMQQLPQPTTTTSPATTTSDTNLLSQPMMLMQQVVSPSVEMQQLPQPTTTTSPATTTSDTNLLSQPMMLMQQVVSPSVEMQQLPQPTKTTSPATTTSVTNLLSQPMTLMQQVVSLSGEVQQLPIQLTQAQLNMIMLQVQHNLMQPVIIQKQPPQPVNSPQIIQVTQAQPQQHIFLAQMGTSLEES